ncbi:uncharacterized protein [Nicotiana sylvestris]|uniref:uncharacterized protein n=1 Tax=Nicotiana sylvestris TaxID=4096 RepID=UPI00388C5CC8
MAKLKVQWGIRIEKHRRHLNQSKRDHEKTVAKMKKEMAILEIKAADQAKNFQIESRYWYDSLAQMKLEHIKRILSTPYHPTANGQAESSNKVILNILKKKLEEAKGLWPELLPEVLWAYRTILKTSTGETPYSLVYETDAVIPVEVGEPSLGYSNESGPINDESRLQDMDEVKERRDMTHIRMVAQKQQVERHHNKKAKVRPLKVGDYVLKAKTQASKDPNEGKLGTNWDGPYKIVAAANKSAF